MVSLPVKRLFWKEYRAQSSIWLSLLAGTFLLQLLFVVLGEDFRRSMSGYPLYVALVLTICYAGTSIALLFAGETEEQTDGWLRQLPVQVRQLLIGKLSFTLISTILFALAAGGLGAAINSTRPDLARSMPSFWQDTADGVLQGSVGLLLLVLFFSLLLSRVMTVLIVSLATYLGVAAFVGNVLSYNLWTYETWMAGVAVCVAAADIWLARQWLSGPSVIPVFEGDRLAGDYRRRLWLKGVTWAARRTPLSARTGGVLAWRELRAAVPFAIGWSLLGILSVRILTGVWGSGMNHLWLFATPLVCGLMTCVGDNRANVLRFLTDRGLRPLTIWLTKHAIWLTLATGLVLVFGTFDVLTAAQSEIFDYRSTWENLLFNQHILRNMRHADPNFVYESAITAQRIVMACSLGIMLYAAGHLCSLWFRRAVVAFSVAAFAGVLIVGWYYMMGGLDVASRYATWPLVAATVAASVATIGGWLRETSTWPHKLAQLAWVVVPVCGVMAGAMYWRTTQIPVVLLDFDWQERLAEMENDDPRWSSRWRQMLVDLRMGGTGNLRTFKNRRWNDLRGKPAEADEATNATNTQIRSGNAVSYSTGSEGSSGATGWPDVLDERISASSVLTELRALADELAEQEPRINPRMFIEQPDARDSLHRLGQFVVEAAYQYRRQGDLDEAWAILADGLRLTDYLPTQAVHTWEVSSCWEARRLILLEVHAWAADEQQTIDRLEQAYDYWGPDAAMENMRPVEMWKNRYAFYRHALEDWDSVSSDWLIGYLNHNAVAPPFERRRAIRLMGAWTAAWMWGELDFERNRRLALLTPRYSSDDVSPVDLGRWEATTPLLPHDFSSDVYLNFRPTLATEGATPVILRMQQFRVEQEQLPASLAELAAASEMSVPVDAATGENYGYAPEGFPAPVVIATRNVRPPVVVVPAHTPLLWSPGAAEGQIIRANNGKYYVSTVNADRNRDLPGQLAEGTVPPLVGNFPPATSDDDSETEPAPSSRLLFVILGQRPW